MAPTFLVTAHGRSGTKWLARELNRSRKWTVPHEGDGIFEGRENYGEVNSYLRHKAATIKVDKLAVIVRHPIGIARSAYFKKPDNWKRFLGNLQADLKALDKLLSMDDTIHIDFNEMTTSQGYTQALAGKLGVTDLQRQSIDMEPTNSSSVGELPLAYKQIVDYETKWYRDKWC